MSKIFKRFENRYTQVPNEILNLKNLSFKAKGIYGYLISKPDGWNFSVKGLSSQSKDGLDAVRSGVKELEDLKYLRRQAVKSKGGQWDGYDYYIYDEPYSVEGLPVEDFTVVGKPDDGKLGNPSNTVLSNTDLSKTKGRAQNKNSAPPEDKSEQDLFGKKPKANSKILFKNSAYFEMSIFKTKLKELDAVGVDLEFYHRQINNWSESKTVKRTANGWIATARTFMEKDKQAGKLQMVKTEEEQKDLDQDMIDYLNM